MFCSKKLQKNMIEYINFVSSEEGNPTDDGDIL